MVGRKRTGKMREIEKGRTYFINLFSLKADNFCVQGD